MGLVKNRVFAFWLFTTSFLLRLNLSIGDGAFSDCLFISESSPNFFPTEYKLNMNEVIKFGLTFHDCLKVCHEGNSGSVILSLKPITS